LKKAWNPSAKKKSDFADSIFKYINDILHSEIIHLPQNLGSIGSNVCGSNQII